MPFNRSLSIPQITALSLAALCVLGLLIYAPGLSGGFIFDDSTTITKNGNVHIHSLTVQSVKAAMLSSDSGPLKRPISMLSFALNYYLSGLDPFWFKLTNVVIHLLNGVGLFFLTRLLLAVYRERFDDRLTEEHALLVSIAVSAAWVLHPINLTGVLYVVQRMTSLSALFTIWGLVLYTAGRQRINHGRPGTAMILTAVLAFTPLAVLSKENGALLPAFMLLIEYVLLGFQAPRTDQSRFLYGLFLLVIGLPALVIGAYTVAHPQWILGGYKIREFTLSDRVLTEARVLWFYVKLILMPSNAQLGLFHDDIPVSHGLLSPPGTLAAVTGLAGAAAMGLWCRRRAPLVSLGVLWYLLGHSVESTVLPLELVHEHRNYLPAYGILLPVLYYLLYPLAATKTLRIRRALAGAFVVMLAVSTTVRASDWGNPVLLAVVQAEHHPESARANHYAGVIYSTLAEAAKTPQEKDKYYRLAVSHMEKSGRVGGQDLDGLFGVITLQDTFKHPLDERTVHTLLDRLRHLPFASNTSNDFMVMVDCQEQENCHFPPFLLNKLFNAALENPSLKGRTRVAVLATASEHLVNGLGDFRDALKLIRQAVALDPKNPLSRLNYAKLLAANGKNNQARQQLQKAGALDTWGVYAAKIAEQQELLAQTKDPQVRPQDVKSHSSGPVAAPANTRKGENGV